MLPFIDYMAYRLYDAEKGYYESNRLGEDFFTTPMRTDALAYALYKRIIPLLKNNHTISYVEIGPGRLQLTYAMLQLLEKDFSVIRVVLIEKSHALRVWQKEHIAKYWPQKWQDRVSIQEELYETIIDSVCVAHEVLDAMPVALLQYCKGAWYNILVDTTPSIPELVQGEKHARPPTPWADKDYSDGSRYEFSPLLVPWITHLVHHLPGSLMLWIDYGDDAQHIYHPMRPLGTIRAYHEHKIVPWYTPHSDLTADVNWSAVGEILAPYAEYMALEFQSDIMANALEDMEKYGLCIQKIHRYFFDPLQMARRIQVMTVRLRDYFSE